MVGTEIYTFQLKKTMNKFIIDKINDPLLLHCILPVVDTNGEFLTLEYNNFNGGKSYVVVHINDGEFYNENVRLRREKELMIENVKELMDKHNISIDDL